MSEEAVNVSKREGEDGGDETSNKRPKLEEQEGKKEDSGKDAETKDAALAADPSQVAAASKADEATDSGKVENEAGDTAVKNDNVTGAEGSQATAATASASSNPTPVAANATPPSTDTNNSATAPAPAPSASTIPGGLPPPVDPNAAATLVNPESIVEERGEVSPLYVGRVIGKGGEMIRDLQARSGCRMDVDQNVPPGHPRVITYRGTRKTVDFAKRLVQMLCAENASEADLPLGEAKREFLVVPAQSVGKIIGRGGEMIRELQSRSQAKIQVDHTGSSGLDPSEKQVTITATVQAVAKAKEMVLFLVANPLMDAMQAINMLVEDKVHRGGVWGSGPPYPNLPNGGQNMQPNSGGGYGYDQQGGYYGAAPAAGGGYGAPPAAAPYGAPPSGYGAPAPAYQQQAPAPAPYGQYGAAGGGVEMETFYAAKNFMGRIIGQKGVTINDLQRRSACDIQINQDVPPGQDCEISIRGSRQGIEMVKQMLREIIEIGPNHPYAGGQGGGSGGYQNHGYGQAPQQSYGYQQPQQPAYGSNGYGQQYNAGQYGRPMGQNAASYGQPATAYQGGQTYGQPQAPPAAASEWKTATAPDGQVYYYNERTGATQWDPPTNM